MIFSDADYKPSVEERIRNLFGLFEPSTDFYKNESYAVKKFRKILIKYFTGIEGVTDIKRNIYKIISYREVEDLLFMNLLNRKIF